MASSSSSAGAAAAAARISGNRPSDHKTGPAGEPMTPVPSASLVVLCPLGSASSGSTATTYTTLMLERSARIGSSFRSAVVFPGGQLDMADEVPFLDRSSNALLEVSESRGEKKMLEMDIRDEHGYMNALKLCALRETFEEAGLLLMPSSTAAAARGGMPLSRAVGYEEVGMKKEEWFAIREQVHNDASHFVPFLHRVWSALGNKSESSSDLPPLAGMTHHSNWVTPRSVVRPAKRFDAHFLITCLDRPDVFGSSPPTDRGDNSSSSGSSSVAAHADIGLAVDGKEAASLRLGSPRSLLQAAFEDRHILYPPQAYILADLAAHIESHPAGPHSGAGRLQCIAPLAFGAARPAPDTVTKVEEEARGLGGRNYTWERRTGTPPSQQDIDRVGQGSGVDPSSAAWVSTDSAPFMPSASTSPNKVKADLELLRQGVTAIEPHPLIKQGANVPVSAAPEHDSSPSGSKGAVGESGDEVEEMFVFPLVLPGDYQASAAQRAAAGQDLSDDRRGAGINRLYVSPRSREQGGGLVFKGAKRAGVGALMDFEIGLVLRDEPGDEEEEEDETESGEPIRKTRL